MYIVAGVLMCRRHRRHHSLGAQNGYTSGNISWICDDPVQKEGQGSHVSLIYRCKQLQMELQARLQLVANICNTLANVCR